MKTTPVKWLFLISAAAVLTLCYCGLNPPDGGNSSQVGNPALAGVVYNQDGTRAANAKVRIARWNADPQAGNVIADSTVSNDTGGYAIDSLITDTFNLLASSGVFLGYEDSITVKSDSTTLAPPCTLKATGSVRGVVRLEPGDNSTNVYILFMGTNTFVSPNDSIGNFVAANLAEGRYKVKIITTLPDYDPMDTNFTITAGVDAVLPDTLRLHYTGIPLPEELRIEYDTMKQIVTLYWNTPTIGRPVSSYNVYKRNVDSNTVLARINTTPVTDTTFTDSTGVQDQTYEYQIAAVDTSASEGIKSPTINVKIAEIFTVTDSIVKGYAVGVDGNFGGIARGVLDESGNFYIVDNINKWLQKFDLTGNFIFKVNSFSMPIAIANHLDSSLFICDHNTWEIIKTDLSGAVDTTFSTIGRPSGVCTRNDSVFISSDSGIIIHDLQGRQLNAVRYSFSTALSQPNVIASNNGKLYAIEDRGAFEIDIQAQTVKNIWSFSDQYSNQQAMICQYGGDTLAIVSSGGNAPFFSSLYLINTNGSLIAKCKLRYGIGGITKPSTANTLIGFSSDGKILSLTM